MRSQSKEVSKKRMDWRAADMASSSHMELEMIEQGLIPDPAADGMIPQQVYSEIGPDDRSSLDPSDPLPSMTPQQRNERREGVLSAPSDETPIDGGRSTQQLELLDLDFPQRPVLDDIDMILRRKAREVRLGDTAILKLTKDQMNVSDKEGFVLLHYAVLDQRKDIIEKLIDAKCDRKARTKDGLTPLHIAACQLSRGSDSSAETGGAADTSCKVIQLLLRPDVKSVRHLLVAQEDLRKRTPLHLACSRANVSAVQELLMHIHVIDVDQRIVNMKDNHGDTPLHEACIRGDVGIVKDLLKHGANPDDENNDRMNPLEIACMANYVKVVQAILDYSRESREWNKPHVRMSKNNVMCLAVEKGDVEMVNVLLGYKEISSRKGDVKVAPIHIAAKHGYIDIAMKLLDHDESCKDLPDEQQHRSPLHYAARNNQVEIIKLLLFKRCNKDMLDSDSVSPLLLSVKCGKARAVNVLIEAGCNIRTTDMDGKSVIYWAAQEGHLDVLKVILGHEEGHALLFDSLYYVNTPFYVAAKMGRTEVLKLLTTHLHGHLQQYLEQMSEEREQEKLKKEMLMLKHYEFRNTQKTTHLHLAAICGNLEVVKILVCKYYPSIADKDEDDKTALHLAICHGKTEVAAFLIHKGAKVDARSWLRFTPLHTAAQHGNTEIASLLIEFDGPLEAKDTYHRTPLHVAAEEGHAEIVSLLTGAGANCEAKADLNKTPLWLACSKGHLAAAEVLIEKGASVEDGGCLDFAVKEGHKNFALAIIQSKQWKAALRHSDWQTFRRMIKKMPFVAKAVLDRCMKTNADSEEDTNKVWVKFNYEFLEDRTGRKIGKHPLAQMVKYSRRKLLQHPVVTSLLEYKWRRYGGMLFFTNLFLYLIFLFFLTMYALRLPHPDHIFCYDFSVSQQVPSLPVNGTVCPFESAFANRSDVLNNKYTVDPRILLDNHANASLYFAAVMVIIFVFIRLLLELCQFVRQRYRYFLKLENYIELLVYMSSVIFISHFGTNCWCPTNWQWQLGAIAVFLAWINLILFLKRVPLLGIYVLMFNAILHSFLKFALIAFLFVVAFCIAFYMILYKALDDATLVVNVSPFRNAGLSFIKTMVMAIGEFDYDNIFGHNNESRSLLSSFPVVAYILWIIFLIIMPILVTNLLVGLAVGDIKAIQDEAELRSNLLQIEADELLPVSIRRWFIKEPKRTIYFSNQKIENEARTVHVRRWVSLFWGKVLEKTWGVECWDSLDNIRKCKQRFSEQLKKFNNKQDQTQAKAPSGKKGKQHTEVSPSAPVPDQTGDLSRKVQQLQTEMTKLMEKNNRIMEKNMEQILQLMAQKQGIRVEEADRVDEDVV